MTRVKYTSTDASDIFDRGVMSQVAYIHSGLLISNIDIDIDSIDDTFGVLISVSTILLGQGIASSIDDTF